MAGARSAATRLTHSSLFLLSRAAAAAATRHPNLPFSPRDYSKMASSVGSNGYSDVTRVLFCGHYWPASTIYTKEYLQNYPFIQVDEVSLEHVPDVIQDYHICVVKNKCIDSDIIAKATKMKIIMQYGVGLEGVDINAATEQKIKVARIPGSTTGNAIACAEMAIYLTLGVLRKQKEMDTAVIQKDLGLPVGETIFGKTILILGFGAIGMEIAKRLRPFGVKILATKRNWSSNTVSCDLDGLVDKKGGPEDMYELAREADIVITCMTLNNESVGIVDHKFLSALKKTTCNLATQFRDLERERNELKLELELSQRNLDRVQKEMKIMGDTMKKALEEKDKALADAQKEARLKMAEATKKLAAVGKVEEENTRLKQERAAWTKKMEDLARKRAAVEQHLGDYTLRLGAMLKEFCRDLDEETQRVEPMLDPINSPVGDEVAMRTFRLESRISSVLAYLERLKSALTAISEELWPEHPHHSELESIMTRLNEIPDRVRVWKKSAARCGADVALSLVRVHCQEVKEEKLKELQVANTKKLKFEDFMETFIAAATRIADGIDLDTFVEPSSPPPEPSAP